MEQRRRPSAIPVPALQDEAAISVDARCFVSNNCRNHSFTYRFPSVELARSISSTLQQKGPTASAKAFFDFIALRQRTGNMRA
jgi:hypothetical protein